MAGLSPYVLGIALALLVIANPVVSDDKCRTGCHGATPNTFKFAEGTTYKYNLEGNIDIGVSSAEGQSSTTKLKATVLLTQLPQCNQVLRLQNVEVISADGKKFTNIPNVDKPVRLNFHDGHIEDLICAEKGDTQVSLNIKRAAASLFQANLKNQYETDVFGLCPTDVSSKKEGAFFIVNKHKNLNKCSHRENLRQGFMATAFNLNSEMKTSPILNSDLTSEQKIKNGILDQATVTETYLYVPFSVGKSGAKATVTTKLQFAGQSKENPKQTCTEPKSIIFENPHPMPAEKPTASNLIEALKKATETVTDTVGKHTAKGFINVIQIMRASKKEDLLRAYDEVKKGTGFKDKVIAQKFFLNALTKAGTGEAVEVALVLLKKKEITCKFMQKAVYLGLSFVRHATPASVATAMTLLDDKDVPREAYLGVGSLAGTYCRQHPNCGTQDAIKKLVGKFQAKLGDGKTSNRNQENELVYILKAIRNMHYIDDSLVTKIVAIAGNKNAPTRLRVAALEAYLGDACKDKFRDSALNIMKDIQQDSEIRIKAYLAATECPNGKVAGALKKLLDDEPSIQVKGYIVSHLRNIKASTNPDKTLAKEQLGNLNLNQQYPIDFRRFSQNFEFSHGIDTLGMANTVDADLIYSQNSFLPRSTSLNLTTDVFGYRYNFLEVSTRQENLDKVLEHYFGPQGLLRKPEAKEQLAEKMEAFREHLEDRAKKLTGHRVKRDVSKAEIDNIGKQIQIKTNELNKDLDVDFSVKMLGSEIFFQSITENCKGFTPNAMVDKFFDQAEQGLESAKSFDQTFHSDHLFLDVEVAYPTSFGFPLKITVDGASSTQLQAKGNVDIIAILAGIDKSIAKLSLIPSANIEVVGKLTVDAYVVENGLKVASTVYSSTGGAAEFQVFSDKSSGYDLKYTLPLQQQELISANHDIVLNTRELGQSEVDKPLKFAQLKDFEVTVDQLSPFIGLEFSAQINRPNAPVSSQALPFPLDGHSTFGVTIKNVDLKEVHIKSVVDQTDKLSKYEEVYEIVGTDGPKLKLASILSSLPDKFFKIDFTAKDLKSAGLEGKLVDTDAEKSFFLKGYVDTAEAYTKAGIHISGGGNRYVYKPFFDYKYPNMQEKPYRVEGQIIHTKGATGELTFDNFKVITPDNKNIIVKGSVGTKEGGFFSDISVGDGQHTGTLKGNAFFGETIKVNAELQNTFNPDVNLKIQYDLALDNKGPYDSKLILIHGKDLSSKTNKLVLINSLKGQFNSSAPQQFQAKNELSYPAKQIDAKLNFGETPKSVNYDVDFAYEDVKFGSKLDFKFDQKVDDDYDFEFEVHGVKNKLEVKAKRVIKGDKSDITNVLDINGKKLEVRGTITHVDNDDKTNYSGDLIVKVPTQNEAYKVGYGFVVTNKDLDTLLKVQAGSTVVVDNFLKLTQEGDANGVVKMNFNGVFAANGQLKSVKGKGNGQIVLDFIKVGRKFKTETAFTIVDPTYDVDLTVYTDFEKDNNKKYVFSSHNKISETTFDSAMSYEYQGQKFETNLKGSFEGELMDGKQLVEAEVIFPNELYLLGKINREIHMTDEEVINGNLFINVEQRKNKNTPGLKFTFKGAAKDTDFAEDILDISYGFSLDNSQGKNLNGDFTLQNLPKGEDNHLFDLKSKLYGSVMPNTYEGNVHSEYTDETGNYKINAKYGPKNSLDIVGKYDLDGEKKPFSGDIDFVLHTSSPQLAVVKYHAAGSLGIGLTENVIFEAQGKTSIFVDDAGENKDTTLDLKYDGAIKVGDKDSELKATIKFQQEDPITIASTFSYDEDEVKDIVKSHGTTAITYAKDKTLKVDFNYDQPNKREFSLDAKVLTPSDKAKNTRVQWHAKLTEDENKLNSDLKLTADGKVYELLTDFDSKSDAPSLSLVLKHPDGKVDEISSKVKKITPKSFAGDFKLAYAANDFALSASIDSHVESVDDFTIKATVDCPALKMDKVVLEATNKGGKGGKKIQFTAKSADKNVLSGSTTYKTRDEAGKFIMEGSGSFKVGEETKTANFKYSRQDLYLEKDGEEGTDLSFDASVGNKAVDAELKITNKHFRFLNSYCEEKKQCAHVEVDSKINVADAKEFNHVLEVTVDLRKLGLSHEFGLKSVTATKGYVLDHTVDVHFQSQDNSKYQYSLYFHPMKAGASLTTPKRIVAIEGTFAPAQSKKGALEGQLAIYMDKKNKPNEKTLLYVFMDDDVEGKKVHVNKYTAKFSTPGLGKDLSIDYSSKYNIDAGTYEFTEIIDVFAKPNQKIIFTGKVTIGSKSIESTASAKSAGLNIDIKADEKLVFDTEASALKYNANLNYNFDKVKFTSTGKLELLQNEFIAYAKIMDKELLNLVSKSKIENDQLTLDTDFAAYGIKPLVSHIEVKPFNSYSVSVYRKATPNEKLLINTAFIPGQIADARAEIVKGGKKIDLVHGSVKLDEANFLKSDYGLQLEEIKNSVLEPVKQDVIGAASAQKEFMNTVTSDTASHLNSAAEIYKKNSPNFQPAKEYYVSELTKVKEELVSDKTLKDATDFLREVFGATAQAISEIFAKVMDFNEKVFTAIQASFVKVTEAIEKEFVPKFKVFQDQIGSLVGEVFEVTTNTFFTFLAKVSQFIDAHQEEIKGITTSITSITSDLTRAIFKAFDEAKVAVQHEIKNVLEELKALPIVEQIKATYEEFTKDLHISEVVVNFITELKSFSENTDNPELRKLLVDVADYLIKKVQREAVDDKKAIQQIIKDFTQFVDKLKIGVDVKEGSGPKAGINLDFLTKLPRLVGADFSPFNYAMEEYDFSEEQFLYNVAFNPYLVIPPLQLQALVVQGQHIFTFDGKHLTFPGNCNYLLARDAVNGNFTIAGTYANGFLTALTIADKHDSVTIKNTGQCSVNNAAHEYPVRKQSIEATKDYNSIIVRSKAGVKVICDFELKGCAFLISGYYHGQLKGLLGNGNAEPYDDFTLPNGKIVTAEGDFGNAYKMQASCAPVKTVDHKTHTHNKECTKYFTDDDSELSECFPFVPQGIYRTACDHGMAAKIKDTVQWTVSAYATACSLRGIDTSIPDEFVKCTNGEKPRSIDDSFSIKLPTKAADVVIVIDETKANEVIYKELITNMVAELTKEFQSKKITDVEYHFIGYGGEHNHRPYHYTVANKFTTKGKTPNIPFTTPKPVKYSDAFEPFERMCTVLKELFGLTPQFKAYSAAISYPFRAHAVKTVIAVTGHSCSEAPIPKELFEFIAEIRTIFIDDDNINLNLITPFEKDEFSCKDAKTTQTVVGFNQHNVFTYNDFKKKTEGSPDLRDSLEYDDFCVDYVLEKGGSVFISNNFLAAKGPLRKQFAAVAAHNIAHKLVTSTERVNCDCERVNFFSAKNVCEAE